MNGLCGLQNDGLRTPLGTRPLGFLNTWWIRGVERNDDRYHTWVNCMLATAEALANLAKE